jgi:hypothetical protein
MDCFREIRETLEGHLPVHYHHVFLVLKGKLQQSVDLVARIAGHSDGGAPSVQLWQSKGKLSKKQICMVWRRMYRESGQRAG